MPVWGVICIYACSDVCVCLFRELFVFLHVLTLVCACFGSYMYLCAFSRLYVPVCGVICIYACSDVCMCLFGELFVFMPVLRFVCACLRSYLYF